MIVTNGRGVKTMRSAVPADAEAICAIYNHYVANTIITFEEEPVSTAEMAERIRETIDGGLPWLVEETAGRIVGYAYASKWKSRCAYRFAVETTIYVAADAQGQGIGTRLYEALLQRLREAKMHVAIGGVALPNDTSVRLHEKFGFKKVAEFAEVGFKFNKRINVAYWQTKL
jgi:phosphinothricin acetyltransferase